MDSSQKLLITYELPVRYLVWFTYYVSLFGFFTSISLTLIKDQTEAITTWWCPVFDILPTLSAATGYFYPQIYIWPICIGLTSFPRYLIVFLQMNDRLSRLHFTYRQSYVWTERINAFLHFLEITFLILISFVSVRERQDFHNYFVFAFGIVSTLHMFLTASIDYLWPQTSTAKVTETQLKIRSKRLKLFFINFFAFFSSICLYFYHLNSCITLLRSAHSFFQYVFILSNAAYHRLLVDEWDQQGTIKFTCCIGITLVKDREDAVRTWCPVFDFFPTISASTGYFYPQAYIWRICIGLASFPRIVIAIVHMRYRSLRPYMTHRRELLWAERFNGTLHILELIFLLLLSFVSLKETEWVHVYSYFMFAMFSILHMLSTSTIDYLWPQTIYGQISEIEMKMQAKRFKLFLFSTLTFILSMATYYYHLSVCVNMLYSTHSLLEYAFVLTNIIYHGLVMDEWGKHGQIHLVWL